MIIIIALVIIFLFPLPRFLVKHFYHIVFNGIRDIYYYFKHKKYNECTLFGRILLVTAYRNKVFGSGKTLDMVKFVREIYNQYNGLEVWNESKKCFVKQKIHIISNVHLKDIPYTKFISVDQIKNVIQDEMDLTFFVFDEIGAIWNSRNFKTNISTDLLKRLLQVRKNKICIIGTSQRFKFVDALLRQITGELVAVNKTWRILKLRYYDPVSFETCDNIDMLKPLQVKYKFVFNKDYNAYDTSQLVEDLAKEDMLTEAEILANQGVITPSIDFTTGLKRRYRKKQ